MSEHELEHELGHAELEVLKVLWEESPCTVRDVLNRLHERGRNVAYTTVMTFLTRLEQKRYVSSDKSGQAYVYRPRIERERVMRSRLRSVVEQLYDGAACPLVLQLLDSERFTRDEIAQLQELIDRLDRETGKRAGLKRKK